MPEYRDPERYYTSALAMHFVEANRKPSAQARIFYRIIPLSIMYSLSWIVKSSTSSVIGCGIVTLAVRIWTRSLPPIICRIGRRIPEGGSCTVNPHESLSSSHCIQQCVNLKPVSHICRRVRSRQRSHCKSW